MSLDAPADGPLTREMIGVAIERLGLMRPGESWDCEPLAGGVSSDIWQVRVGDQRYCLKRALPRLKTAQHWEAPVNRNTYEWKWLRLAREVCPDAVPTPVAQDVEGNLFVMRYLERVAYPTWKELLSKGIVRFDTATSVAGRLVDIHNATAGKEVVAREFQTDDSFYSLRLESYLVATGWVHTDLAARLAELVHTTLNTKCALVHGDVSPKNILIGPRGPVFIDAECAWYGDPAFDLAFCLNHLLLKCLWLPSAAGRFLSAFDCLAERYLDGVAWEPRKMIEARTAHLLPGLFLARVDGKSPVEYITNEFDRNRVRKVARPLIAQPVEALKTVRDAWAKEVLHEQ